MFIDTNYFLRFLLKDNEEQYQKVKTLFIEASDKRVKLLTSTIVFFEIYWILMSYYHKQKKPVISMLGKILQLHFIELKERQVLTESLILFNNSLLSLEDCYNLYYAKSHNISSFKTFDKKLEKEFLK